MPTSTRSEPSTSPTFHSNLVVDNCPPDLTIISVDGVRFHGHRSWILSISSNSFAGLLTESTDNLTLPEHAIVIDIVLHITYGMFYAGQLPPLDATDAALKALMKYGMPIQALSSPGSPFYQLILSYAPYYPIEAYALAAHHNLEDLAVAISSHLLAYDLTTLSDELATKMGPVYFNRLYNLQRARLAALRNIILHPPASHPPTEDCDEEKQKELGRAWAFASAQIVWNALPSTSIPALTLAFAQSGSAVGCPECHTMLQKRVQEVANEWSAVKRTI
ncbi:hypothetical protein C8Q78DRAFT_1074643 [Trametes maxima]|nr:hypothetical protein C8Q78DRAFT_1074643 [Trametes maxima]